MKRQLTAFFSVVLSVILFAAGCWGDSRSEADREDTDQSDTSVKTMDEYRQQAKREISGENAEAELQKLQKEIEDDLSSEEP